MKTTVAVSLAASLLIVPALMWALVPSTSRAYPLPKSPSKEVTRKAPITVSLPPVTVQPKTTLASAPSLLPSRIEIHPLPAVAGGEPIQVYPPLPPAAPADLAPAKTRRQERSEIRRLPPVERELKRLPPQPVVLEEVRPMPEVKRLPQVGFKYGPRRPVYQMVPVPGGPPGWTIYQRKRVAWLDPILPQESQ